MTTTKPMATLILGIAVAACTPTPAPPSPAPTASRGANSPTGIASDVPSVPPTTTTAAIPNPGGTCDATRFVLTSNPVAFPGYAAAGYELVFVSQRIRNVGARCVIQLPGVVGLASADGVVQPVPVSISRSPASIDIGAGQSMSIVVGDTWWSGGHTDTGATAAPAPPCAGRIRDVRHVVVPFALGSIEIAWDEPWGWREVCASPPSVTVTIEEPSPTAPVLVPVAP